MQDAKGPETRTRRIAGYVEMLADGRTPYPQGILARLPDQVSAFDDVLAANADSVTGRGTVPPQVRAVDPRTDSDWLKLSRGPGGSLFTSPTWIGAVCDTYGFDPTARALGGPDGRSRAGLTWVDVRDLRGGRRLALPFCDRAEPIVADEDEWTTVASDALAGDLPFTLRCLDGSPAAADTRLTRTGEAAWHRTLLGPGPDRLHAAFRPQTRRNIAKADRCCVRGELRAAAMYLVWQDTVYYKFGASRAELPGGPPQRRAALAVDPLGSRSRPAGSGLGLVRPGSTRPRGLQAELGLRGGRIATLNAGGRPLGRRTDVEDMLREMTALLTEPDVPDPVAERGGAALYRYFC